MTMSEQYLIDLLPDQPSGQFDFEGTYTDAAGETYALEIFSTSWFIMQVTMLYAMRKIMVDDDNKKTFFQSVFTTWASNRLPYYLKQAYAYTLKYNPIENYSSLETMTNDITTHLKNSSLTDTFTNTDTLTKNTTDTDTHTPFTSVTTTNSTKGFNSSDFADVDKSVDTWTGSEANTIVHSGYDTNAHTGSITHANSGTDTDTRNYTLTKKGNIGVQTASEMLQKEYDGLFQDLAFRALREFIDRYTFYTEVI
ncbi:hypothetical protein IKZ77_03425 [Candidatus Saccharibacteria bacterium]|nr:hypothetical protein [Candidatus Saccharibacteria bacterium]